MAVKRTVHEFCPKCGQKVSVTFWPNGDVRWVSHNCPKAPPGPPNGPTQFQPGDTEYQRGNWPVGRGVWRIDVDLATVESFSILRDADGQWIVYAALKGGSTHPVATLSAEQLERALKWIGANATMGGTPGAVFGE